VDFSGISSSLEEASSDFTRDFLFFSSKNKKKGI